MVDIQHVTKRELLSTQSQTIKVYGKIQKSKNSEKSVKFEFMYFIYFPNSRTS
jgi:hypothetical protein